MNGRTKKSAQQPLEAVKVIASKTLEVKLPPKKIPKSVEERNQQLIEGGQDELAKLLYSDL